MEQQNGHCHGSKTGTHILVLSQKSLLVWRDEAYSEYFLVYLYISWSWNLTLGCLRSCSKGELIDETDHHKYGYPLELPVGYENGQGRRDSCPVNTPKVD